MTTWPDVLATLVRGEALPTEVARWAMNEVMSGEATPVQVAGFAVALRAKGETPEELTGLVEAMLGHAQRVAVTGRAVDTCGTGGDRAHTVNISTMAALVVRGAGATVVKHGNRAASSACGSADLLEALGVAVDLPAPAVAACVADAGIGFCFAPVFHPALRHAAASRRELGIPTVFNFLGPLTNPAQPPAQAVGVADPRMAPTMAGVLAARGASALVFRGDDGLDELSTAAPSQVWAVADGEVRTDRVDPRDLGLAPAGPDALRGADAAHNAAVTRAFLAGETGAVRDAVLLNAAAALVAYDGVGPGAVTEQIAATLPRAAEAVDNGAAAAALESWIEVSRSLAGS
ncbi:MAG: anthranilate phosphoribosyltransferase [Frankiaceae bacterium]|nr:anthranilate phosphoribosyltransferase [Frankiaceae bacterium]